jgi:hypothetical protein
MSEGDRKTRCAAEDRQRREAWAKAVATSPAGAALFAAYESLTANGKEDWMLIADGDDLYVTALREHDGKTHMRFGETTVSGLKSGGTKGTIENAVGLGCITVILPTDAEERGGFDLLAWLNGVAARSQGFNIATFVGSAPTNVTVKSWKEDGLALAISAGEA